MDTSFLAGMRYMPQINDPFIGENLGFKHQSKISEFSAKSRIIAGKGVKVTETPQGIIIEASNVTINNLNTNVTPLMTLAQVGTIRGSTDGVYRIDFLAEAEDDEYTTIDSDKFIFVCNNMLAFSSYNEGDSILVYKTLVKTLDSGVTDSIGATGAQAMWAKKNNILKQTNCIAHHPYYGNAQVLLTEDNKPLFFFLYAGETDKAIILDTAPTFEVSAKIPTSTRFVKLTQYGANEFASIGSGIYLIDGYLRADNIFNMPYNTMFDGVRIGAQYWHGSLNIDWWNTGGTTQTFTLNEHNGDTTAEVKVINEEFGYWEKKDNTHTLFGVYIGRGAYDGEYRTIGTPTWQTADSKSTITTYYDLYEDEQIPRGLTLDEEREMYIIGTYGSASGWHEIPKGVFVFGYTITAIGCANEGKEKPANIDLAWQGFTDGNPSLSRVWVADTPSWR